MQTIEALPLPARDHCTVIWVLHPVGGALYYCDYTVVRHELWHNYGQWDCALCEAGLKLKRLKCSFMKRHIEYLGHLISEKGTEPMPEKLSAIKEMPAPRNPKEIKQFLGLVGIIKNSYQDFLI